MRLRTLPLCACLVLTLGMRDATADDMTIDPSRFEVTVLASGLMRPMELAVAPDGKVFFLELDGKLKQYDPQSHAIHLVGELTVTTEQENGLIGLALDPNFAVNQWLYLQYSPPGFSGQHISRFTLRDGKLDLESEKVLLKYEEQRRECCHHAGSMKFGPQGELFIGTGDNTHPGGDSQGYAPIDERDDRAPYDAQKSASNTNSYNGKILRIKPTPDGGYEIPDGNLFAQDGSQGRPEIYAMGCRNPWRLNVDQQTGFVYWGEVGPDAGGDGPRGPRGYDEINQARHAGNFGWPYFIANNLAYFDVDFATGEVGTRYDLNEPINASPNNTGSRILPSPTAAFIYYPYAASTEFPELGTGGRTACAGPVYDYDNASRSTTKFPPAFDRTLFIYEWSRNWIKAVHLDEDSRISKIEPFLPDHQFVRPIDMEFGPDGSLYLLEYGETWGVNQDARLVRIDYVRGNRPPIAKAAAENNIGREPLTVTLSSAGSFDKDGGDDVRFEWRVHRGTQQAVAPETVSTEPNPTITFAEPGVYNVELIATDSHGAVAAASVPVLVGNDRPTIRFLEPAVGEFFDTDKPTRFRIYVRDREDGTSDFDEADEQGIDPLDPDAPARVSVNAATVLAPPPSATGVQVDEEQGPVGMRMMKRSDCFNCHAVNQKRVGPPLVDIASKYRGKEGALDASVKRVLLGSTEAWGKIPMIPHSQHTVEEIREMVGWIYSLETDGAVRVFHGFVGDVAVTAEEEAKGGYLELSATYLDRGVGVVPPLAGSASLFLRNRRIDAEQGDEIHGPQVLGSQSAHGGKFVGAINHEHYVRFADISLDRVKRITVRVASAGAGGQIEMRLDKPDGASIATADVEVNGNWEAWYERTVPVETTSGRHDLYFVFINPINRGGLMNLDSVYFHPD